MRILCFGDSNTYGYDPRGFLGDRYDAEDRWVDILAKKTGHQVINAGVNGRDIPRFFPLPEDLTSADVFLVMLGTNDLLQGATAAEAATRMETFLRYLLPCRKPIVLIAPPPMQRGAWVSTDELVSESILLGKEYEQIAKNLNISFIDTRCQNIELAFDGVHFTEKGHHSFADLLIQSL